jgi:ABC-type glycerol-3-phosphate transport system substrate-binding protein
MYQVEVNKGTLQNHLHYDWWKYLAGILATVFVWSLVTAMTRPQTPAEKKVDIFLVGDYAMEEQLGPISQQILDDFPELLEINFMNIPLGIDPQMDMASRQKLMVMVASQSGDIFILNNEEYEQFAKMGAFISLDDLIDEEIQQYISLEQLEECKKSIESEDENEDTEPHIYGIPLKDVTLFKDTGYNTEDKILGVMAYSKNMEKAIEVMKWIISKGI